MCQMLTPDEDVTMSAMSKCKVSKIIGPSPQAVKSPKYLIDNGASPKLVEKSFFP